MTCSIRINLLKTGQAGVRKGGGLDGITLGGLRENIISI
jgi:hypothetical protein